MGRKWFAAGALALGLAALPGVPAAAVGQTSSPDVIELDEGVRVHELVPGQTTLWPVGVTSRAGDVESLRLSLTSEGPLAGYSNEFAKAVTVAVDACALPWEGGHCAAGGIQIIAPTQLATLRTQSAELPNASGMVPDGLHILTRVTLDADAGAAVQNESVTLQLGVFASGAPAGGDGDLNVPPDLGDGHEAVADGGAGTDTDSGVYEEPLPHTGFNLAGYGLLGILAVTSGLVLSRWAALRLKSV